MSVTRRACRCAVGSEQRSPPHLRAQTQPGRQAEAGTGAEAEELEGVELARRARRRPGWSDGQGRGAESGAEPSGHLESLWTSSPGRGTPLFEGFITVPAAHLCF